MLTQRETTPEVARELLSYADIKHNDLVLEPSAGVGNVAKVIRELNPNALLHCVELNKAKRESLKKSEFNVVGADYFLYKPKELYDWIIGLPNFQGSADCKHVAKMYHDTKEGGTIISLMSTTWIEGDDIIHRAFREWLKGKDYEYYPLVNNPFKEDGKTVPCIILKIKK
jgi:hypothetical protein